MATASAATYETSPGNVIRVNADKPASVSSSNSGSYSYSTGSSQVYVHIPITSLSQKIVGSQSNDISYSTGNGITVSDKTESQNRPSIYEDEQGNLIQTDSTLVKSGSFSYTSPEGIPISLNYIADENGYRPQGDHLPLPVEKLPEVLQAEQEHFATQREILSRTPAVASSSLSSSSYDVPPVEAVRSSYESPAALAPAPVVYQKSTPELVKINYQDAPGESAPAQVIQEPAQKVIKASSYNAPSVVVVRSSYESQATPAPAIVRESAPKVVKTSSYNAPSVVVVKSSYESPAPAPAPIAFRESSPQLVKIEYHEAQLESQPAQRIGETPYVIRIVAPPPVTKLVGFEY